MIVDEYIKFTEAKQEEKKINEKINKSVENITKSIKTFIETNFDDNKSWFRGMEYDFGWGLNIFCKNYVPYELIQFLIINGLKIEISHKDGEKYIMITIIGG